MKIASYLMRPDGPRPPYPEEAVILECIRAEEEPSALDRLRCLIRARDPDWDRIWTLAAAYEVHPLVARGLMAAELADVVPDALRDRAKETRRVTLLQNMALHAELHRVAEALHDQRIPVAPLKGTHVAERLYGSLDARRSGDIDILVQKNRLAQARTVLLELGYDEARGVSPGIEAHTFHGVPYVRSVGHLTFVIELHWGLNHHAFVSIDYEQLWRRILIAGDDSSPLRPLPSEETLLFLALHLPKHEDGVLRLLADVDRLVRHEADRFDWTLVVKLAREWDTIWLLYFALLRAQTLLGTPVPEAVMKQIAPPWWRRAAVELLAGPAVTLAPPTPPHLRSNQSILAYCAMLKPFARTLRAYWHYLYPPPTPRPSGLTHWITREVLRMGHGAMWTCLTLGGAAWSRRRYQHLLRDRALEPAAEFSPAPQPIRSIGTL